MWPNDLKDPFPTCLRRRLRERNVNQKQLADDLKISANTVSAWATGGHSPKAVILPRLAHNLDTNVGALFGETTESSGGGRAGQDGAAVALDLMHRLAGLGIGESAARLVDSAPDLLEILQLAEAAKS